MVFKMDKDYAKQLIWQIRRELGGNLLFDLGEIEHLLDDPNYYYDVYHGKQDEYIAYYTKQAVESRKEFNRLFRNLIDALKDDDE